MMNKVREYYWKGKKAEEEGDIESAIFFYEEYSKVLDIQNQHIPKLWIYKFLLQKGEIEKSREKAKEYLEGCSYPHASNKAKEFSNKFQELGYDKLSEEFKDLSKKYAELQKELRQNNV